MKGSPICPEQLGDEKNYKTLGFVFDIVNELIIENFSNGQAIIYQGDIAERIISDNHFENSMLYFEDEYRKKGWYVKYIEKSPPYFIFAK